MRMDSATGLDLDDLQVHQLETMWKQGKTDTVVRLLSYAPPHITAFFMSECLNSFGSHILTNRMIDYYLTHIKDTQPCPPGNGQPSTLPPVHPAAAGT